MPSIHAVRRKSGSGPALAGRRLNPPSDPDRSPRPAKPGKARRRSCKIPGNHNRMSQSAFARTFRRVAQASADFATLPDRRNLGIPIKVFTVQSLLAVGDNEVCPRNSESDWGASHFSWLRRVGRLWPKADASPLHAIECCLKTKIGPTSSIAGFVALPPGQRKRDLPGSERSGHECYPEIGAAKSGRSAACR